MGICYGKSPRLAHASSDQFPGTGMPSVHKKLSPISNGQQSPSTSLNRTVEASKSDASMSTNLKAFSFHDLKNAAKNFRSDSLLGEGGFGCVFKGWIDENTLAPAKPGSGIGVAIKRLKPGSFQGHKEWLAEVNYLGQLRHANLVKLIGYCLESENKLLVYELMPRGSLENHLFRSECPLLLDLFFGRLYDVSFSGLYSQYCYYSSSLLGI
ncbi:hypothetical protein Nepgr_025777 [Nepenthes gracilis]|uniref:non-specific serine/threonine protein kinase n=1 Tax=Nepenthes gracilis TaxID=150966 RepID=A0AAD3T759_NEPGR|nr:hypothetical protein Nepgr_025777 [Nepenthes gracilis]